MKYGVKVVKSFSGMQLKRIWAKMIGRGSVPCSRTFESTGRKVLLTKLKYSPDYCYIHEVLVTLVPLRVSSPKIDMLCTPLLYLHCLQYFLPKQISKVDNRS